MLDALPPGSHLKEYTMPIDILHEDTLLDPRVGENTPASWLAPSDAEHYLGDGIGWLRAEVEGDDAQIVRVARTSHLGAKAVSDGGTLIRHLMRHRHSSPFEFGTITVQTTLPIFVARQLVRHRTAKLSEVSARYCEIPGLFYLTPAHLLARQDPTNKQGRKATPFPAEEAEAIRRRMFNSAKANLALYRDLLARGVARETAREALPQSMYTLWYFRLDLRNCLHLLSLRDDPHAQMETRLWAKALAKRVKEAFPVTYQAYEDYVKNSMTLSAPEVRAFRVCMNTRDPELDIDPKPAWQEAFRRAEFPENRRERSECVAKWRRMCGYEP